VANPSRRGQVAGPVSGQIRGDEDTPFANTSFILPYGLRLQQKVGMVNITNVVDAGATVVYTANNDYSAGNVVSIYGVDPVAYNLQNATILSATSTTFTITSAATGTYVSGGVAQRTGEIPVTIPSGVTFVYAIAVGGGGPGSFFGNAGGGGGVAWGWTLATSSCVVGAGAAGGNTLNTGNGGYTRYGNVITGGGCGADNTPILGGAGSTQNSRTLGSTNYWGIPGGANAAAGIPNVGSGASGAQTSGPGGNGISGGGGRSVGGSGLVGGGCTSGGNGGTGINILTGAITLGGLSTSVNSGGGGGGIAGNGFNSSGSNGGNGGLGGGGGGGSQGPNIGTGGAGGAGILYLFY